MSLPLTGSNAVAPRRPRFYASRRGGPTSRRATDALLLIPALLGLGILVGRYPPGPLERSLSSFLASFPGWAAPLWGLLYDLLALWAIVLIVGVAAGKRGQVAVQTVAGLLVAILVGLASCRLAVGHWPDVLRAIAGGSGSPRFPAFRIAEAGAVVLTVSPYLVLGLQRASRWILALGLLGAVLLHPGSPGGSVAGLLIAVVAAASVRLVFGTSIGRPSIEDVDAALRELGTEAFRLEALRRQVSGVFSLEAETGDGEPLLVKIYGRDAYDTQLLATFWRTLWYQNDGRTLGLSRLQAVEREALVTLLAARAAVATRDVVTAGATVKGDALLVLRGAVVPLAELSEDEDAGLDGYWEALARLRAARIAHRELEPATVALVDGRPGFLDFGHATLTPTADQLMTDSAQLLATTAAHAGSARAVRAAIEALGPDAVAALLPYLQPPAFGGNLRSALDDGGIDVDELRGSVAKAVSAAEPELARLRRVTWGSAVQIGLLLLAVVALVRIAGNVDYTQLKDDLAGASWAWIVAAFAIAQLPRLTQAAASLGSIAADLRFGPVYVLQLATSYLNLALPSSLARMAVSIRFFQRQGQPAAAAVSAGAIGSVGSNLVQALLVVAILLFSSEDLPFDFAAPGSGSLRLLWILIAAVVVTSAVVLLVDRIRRPLVERVREWWPQVKASLGVLRAPQKLALLLGGNLATEFIFALALGLMCRSLGAHIPITELVLINCGASLLSSFIPVPGGIGVVEVALEVGLTAAGMTPSAAFSAIILYRTATFFLPPLWGFFALRWLQRNRYL